MIFLRTFYHDEMKTGATTIIQNVKSTIPHMFNRIPTLAISITRIFPVPNIIAFGGVATGIMNAQDAERVAGIINSNGSRPIDSASAASSGSAIWVVAVFEVSSVRNVIIVQIDATRLISERFDIPAN